MVTFVTKYPSASDQLPIRVCLHLFHSDSFPHMLIEVGQFFNDRLFDEVLWQWILGVLILIDRLKV